jgi:hypothetical protein
MPTIRSSELPLLTEREICERLGIPVRRGRPTDASDTAAALDRAALAARERGAKPKG